MNFIIDENLPKSIATWLSLSASHVRDLGLRSDQEIWQKAVETGAIIITKDTDFFHFASTAKQAKVIKLDIGNMRLQNLREFLTENWPAIASASENCHYVQVSRTEIRGLRR